MSAQPDLLAKLARSPRSIDERFAKFHGENPHVWQMFVRFAFELIARGRKRYSADAIAHRIRWEMAFATTGEDFKLNNDYSQAYARLFAEAYPEHRDFFEMRRRRCA